MNDLSKLAEEAAEADDAAWFKDNAGRIRRGLAEAVIEIEKIRRDYDDAASELLIDINEAQPGSLVSKLLIANRIMARERDAARGAQAELAAMREITTLDFDERKSIATVLKDVLEAQDKFRAKLGGCPSVDPKTGYKCEDGYGHTTDLHCFETYAWPKTTDDA